MRLTILGLVLATCTGCGGRVASSQSNSDTFCSSHGPPASIFCADFDSAGFAEEFTDRGSYSGEILKPDSTLATSTCARVQVQAVAAGERADILRRVLALNELTKLVFSFDLYVGEFPSAGVRVVTLTTLQTDGQSRSIDVEIASGSIQLDFGHGAAGVSLGGGKWVHVVLALEAQSRVPPPPTGEPIGGGVVLDLSANGSPLLTSYFYGSFAPFLGSSVSVGFGGVANSPLAATADYAIDNVVLSTD